MNLVVHKKNPSGNVTYEYNGTLLRRDENTIVLEAFFDREDMPFQDVVLRNGDRFVEYYFSDRWYNVFEIHDRNSGDLKGWYCNIGEPAVFEENIVSYIDLALDLWVSADGTQAVLDADEFQQLVISDSQRSRALEALKELQNLFESKNPPIW